MTEVGMSSAVWPGSQSAKFTTERAHVPKPVVVDTKHPIFNMGGKIHLTQENSKSYEFKPCRKMTKAVNHAEDK